MKNKIILSFIAIVVIFVAIPVIKPIAESSVEQWQAKIKLEREEQRLIDRISENSKKEIQAGIDADWNYKRYIELKNIAEEHNKKGKEIDKYADNLRAEISQAKCKLRVLKEEGRIIEKNSKECYHSNF